MLSDNGIEQLQLRDPINIMFYGSKDSKKISYQGNHI